MNPFQASRVADAAPTIPLGTHATQGATTYLFAQCELDVARRMLRREGVDVAVSPQTFDLLLCFVGRSGRVLTKNELIDAVWAGEPVTDNVIARAVMKVRQALGDTTDPPTLLRTVHRIGYRLAVDVRCASQTTVGPQRPFPEAHSAAVRMAFLPLLNASGNPDCDWVAWGVPGLVEQVITSDRRVMVVSSESVQAVLGGLSMQLDGVARCRALAELLGADVVVQGTLYRLGGRQLRLDWLTVGRIEIAGQLRGADPAAFAQPLAQAIDTALFSDDSWQMTAAFQDPLAAQAFGRALGMQDNWAAAAHLLEVVLDLEPKSTVAQLHYLRALSSVLDPRAFGIGQALLNTASTLGDHRLLAATHEALGRAYFCMAGAGHQQQARRHMDAALALVSPNVHEEWAFRIWFGQAIAAHIRRDYDQARRFYALAWRNNEGIGSPFRKAGILTNQAIIEGSEGSLLLARELAEQALDICERHGLGANAVEARVHLGLSLSAQGLFPQAFQQCEQVLLAMPDLPIYEHECAAWVACFAGDLDLDSPAAQRLPRAVAQLSRFGQPTQARVRSVLWVVQAMQAAGAGRVSEIAALMEEAIQVALAEDHLENAHFHARRWIRLATKLGAGAADARLSRALRTLPQQASDGALSAAWQHATLARQHEEGAHGLALEGLLALIAEAPMGAVQARARLDAAWLSLDQRDADRAARLLRDLGPWLHYHPAGLAVQARLQFVQGRREQAFDTQRICLDLTADWAADWAQQLAALYGDPAGVEADVPMIPKLPSLLF